MNWEGWTEMPGKRYQMVSGKKTAEMRNLVGSKYVLKVYHETEKGYQVIHVYDGDLPWLLRQADRELNNQTYTGE